jgi:hypothetical protein
VHSISTTLKAFHYNIHAESNIPIRGLNLLLDAADASEKTKHYAHYLADLVLLDGKWSLECGPTLLAAAVVLSTHRLGLDGDHPESDEEGKNGKHVAMTEAAPSMDPLATFWETATNQLHLQPSEVNRWCESLSTVVVKVESTQYGKNIHTAYARAVRWEFPETSARGGDAEVEVERESWPRALSPTL